jgi:eukaryotic-like serine/threonine-protein kinase
VSTETTIGGYTLKNVMWTGQTSQTWEVVEGHSFRHFALKLLLPEKVQSGDDRNLLFHEAAVGMSMHHPNVIKMFKCVKDRKNPYIIMEYFPGHNLKLRIMRKHDLLKAKAHSILEQAANGLMHMHMKGWVHRDVKPDNILVNSAGEVRVIDFALAKRINAGGAGFFSRLFGKKGTKLTSGTRSYMSPEQVLGQQLDQRADIYSFGATMYELATGRPPFRGASPGDLLHKHIKEKAISPQTYNPEVTDDCAALILRCLSKDRKDRPKDFHEFLAAFRVTRFFQGDTLEKPTLGR